MHRKSGFTIIEVLIAVAVVAAISGLIIYATAGSKKTPAPQVSQSSAVSPTSTDTTSTKATPTPIWQQTGAGWTATQSPPACPAQPILTSPVDLSLATSILYPGQTRGGNYKPHGGFRFDKATNNQVTVTAPLDGFVMRGGQYLMNGEIQYTFDIINNCGIMNRFGHLRELSDTLKGLVSTWPTAAEGDSRTQNISPPVYISKGTVIATRVGFTKDNNTFVDWGVFDLRSENQASQSAAYQQSHQQDKELSWHAVCWFDWLPSSDAAKIRALPAADSVSGKRSDYCK